MGVLLSFVALFQSCEQDQGLESGLDRSNPQSQRDYEFSNSEAREAGDEMSEYTVLGRERNNPFTVANMRTAINTVYGIDLAIEPTHKYVKFSPAIQEHIAYLEDWETEEQVALFDFPLIYEVLSAGESYIDPSAEDYTMTYRYASVPIGVEMPDVPYIVIENLFLAPMDSYVTETAFSQVGESYEGDTSPHPDWSEPPVLPPNIDGCTPDCDNYPCCKVGWIDCNGTPCNEDEVIPCMPGDPYWPKCLGVNNPPPDGGPNTGTGTGGGAGGGDPEFCECSEYEFGELVYTWIVELEDGEDCSDYEWIDDYTTISCSSFNPPPPPPNNACGCPIPANRNVPAGCIRVDVDGINSAVQNAMVKVKDNWFFWDITWTDISGCWKINEVYSSNVWMWVKFKNGGVKVRDMRYHVGVHVVKDFVDKFTAPPYNNIFIHYNESTNDNTSNGRMYWAAANTLNTVNDYRMRSGAEGVPSPRPGLNWLNKSGNGGAAAPMLQNTTFIAWPVFFVFLNFPYSVALPLLPDVVNRYGIANNGVFESAFQFNETGYHELGHVSHHAVAGESYWFGYRNHIINNNGYGVFDDFALISNEGKVALGEAIGSFTGARYSNNLNAGEFIAFNRPNTVPENFIPRGLMWDLCDGINNWDIVQDPNDNTIQGGDIILDFTPEMIFNSLSSDVTDIREFRDELRVLHLSDTPNSASDFNNFLDLYDVFN